MSASIGLVGLPNAGKSTLFNAITNQKVLVANYPFATIEPNVGLIELKDERLIELATIFESLTIIPATITVTDIAGLIEGAHKGEGLGNQFLSHIRQTDLIAHVVGNFDTEVNTRHNIDIINTELILADLHTVDNHLQKLHKQAQADKEAAIIVNLLKQAQADLNNNLKLYNSPNVADYCNSLKYLNLLTLKPMLYILNSQHSRSNKAVNEQVLEALSDGHNYLMLDAQLEMELSQLSDNDRQSFIDEYGLSKTSIEQLAEISFTMLNLQTFLTAGPKEVKAWVVPSNCPAPQAAGVIHSDIEDGFIAANIVSYGDLLKHKSWINAKEAGLCRIEGKNYLMQPNDVVEFRFNKTK